MNNKTKMIAGACALVGIAVIVIVLLLSGNKTYSVSFNTDGGSFVPMQEVKKGEKASKPTNPTKDGYSFARWEYQSKEYDFTTAVENDLTLNAIWAKDDETEPIKKYQITFTVDGQTKTIEASDVSEINPDNLGFEEKSGYVLKWYVNGKEYNFTEPLTSDMAIEGKYEKTTSYTVKFNSNGGNSVANQTVKVGGKATEPTNVKKEGYILDGWYLNNKKYDFNTEVNKNITLVAKWSEDPNVKRYEVKFNSDGGTNVSSQRVIENKTATQPTNPTKSGYTFDGWYLDNTKYNFSSKVTKNITLVAKWKELAKYTVEFNTDGGSSVASQAVFEGNKATKPANPTKSGYTFKEWQLNNKTYSFDTKITSNITLKAIWEKEKVTYTVEFDTDLGGSKVPNQTVVDGGKATKPANPTRAGYIFTGWYLHYGDSSQYDFNTPVNSNLLIRAEWVKSVKVSFNSNGGSSVASQTIEMGTKATKPANPTKSGSTFKRWLLNGSEYNFNEIVLDDITLTAEWEVNPVVQYTVTFNSNGGSSVASQTVNAGATATKPTNPTWSGHTFKRWLLNGSEYNFSSAVNSNITLTAEWETIKYTVKFNSNGGSSVASQTVNAGATATKPTNPTWSGHTFKRWLLNGSEYNFSSAVNSNITLTAEWEVNPVVQYTVSFNSDGGSSVASQTVNAGATATKPTNPTKAHYNFNKWTLNGNEYNFSSVVNSNITLKATWTQKNFTVKKTPVDNLSLDVRLTVYEEGTQVSFTKITYNGKTIPTTVNGNSLNGITSVQVTLTDGTIVNATMQ